jgi:hypothetical protein
MSLLLWLIWAFKYSSLPKDRPGRRESWGQAPAALGEPYAHGHLLWIRLVSKENLTAFVCRVPTREAAVSGPDVGQSHKHQCGLPHGEIK